MRFLGFLLFSMFATTTFASNVRLHSLTDLVVKQNTSSTDLLIMGAPSKQSDGSVLYYDEEFSCKIKHDVSPKDRPIKAGTSFEVLSSKVNVKIKNKKEIYSILTTYGVSRSAISDIERNVDLSRLDEKNLRKLSIITEGLGIALNNTNSQFSSLTLRIKSKASNKTYSVNCLSGSNSMYNVEQLIGYLYAKGVLFR